MKELVNAAKKIKTPSLMVYLKKEFNRSKDIAEEVMKRMVCITLKDVMEIHQIIYDHPDSPTCVEEDRELVSQFMDIPDDYMNQDIKLSHYVLRMVFNTKQLLTYRIKLSEIVEKIKYIFGDTVSMEYNDEFSSPCVIRLRSMDYKNSIDEDSEVLLKGVIHLLLEDKDVKLLLGGIPGIKKTYLQKDKKTGEYRIETDGSNLAGVFGIPEVDATRTICNDPNEVKYVLGIESTNATGNYELDMTLSFDNNYVNKRHPMLLYDVMTQGGDLMSITRHGLNRRVAYGPLSKCSFEETPEVLHRSARFFQKDGLKGVTENIIMGRNAPVGTHTFSLHLDHKKLEKSNVKVEDTLVSMPVKPTEEFYLNPKKHTKVFTPSSPKRNTEKCAFRPSSPNRL
jgi:DNA-directed RNA polymerase II subunit RPB1